MIQICVLRCVLDGVVILACLAPLSYFQASVPGGEYRGPQVPIFRSVSFLGSSHCTPLVFLMSGCFMGDPTMF
ncbi:hypothetical protein MPTK1_5g18200 [Marchantia polymorpha subsp. ruderalis]|uniref:Uncharacterized protein n=2 Tax=Marchantia polymorpha TaxID=3197 RepID=A0AAF6BJN2_MARPO|nr:hypothetical protein MARPO_0084s0067 [Marchantia polymorpha]BBN12216.1 hypothetical protein Mp_5g18200 [Marchantia polymorpha subsp. ruderalis]|eukprot:PTQ34003.1 hypothetical protein MARPO_0084s0067 [Marchantia polymorpha]